MKIKVRFFGPLQDITKIEEAEMPVKENTTIGDQVMLVGERFPEIREHLKTVSFAIDNEYVTRDAILKNGNEVALLPPISGGCHG